MLNYTPSVLIIYYVIFLISFNTMQHLYGNNDFKCKSGGPIVPSVCSHSRKPEPLNGPGSSASGRMSPSRSGCIHFLISCRYVNNDSVHCTYHILQRMGHGLITHNEEVWLGIIQQLLNPAMHLNYQ